MKENGTTHGVVKVTCATRQLCIVMTDRRDMQNFSELLVKKKKGEGTKHSGYKKYKSKINAAIHPSAYFLRLFVPAVEHYSLRMGSVADHYSVVPGRQHPLLLHLHCRMTAQIGEEEQYSCSEPDPVGEPRYCKIGNGQVASEQTYFQRLFVCPASQKRKLASAVVDKRTDCLLSNYRCIPGADL